MSTNLRGTILDRPASVRQAHVSDLSADAAALLAEIDGIEEPITQDILDDAGSTLGLTACRLEAATLSAIWAGRLVRN